MVGKDEWETLKAYWGNRCAICGYPENKARGKFERTHLKADSKGGVIIIPAHHPCHVRYDNGKLTDSELKRIGLTRQRYTRMMPKKGGDGKPKSEVEKVMKAQGDAVQKALDRQNAAIRRLRRGM